MLAVDLDISRPKKERRTLMIKGAENLKRPTREEAMARGSLGGRRKAENDKYRKTIGEAVRWYLDQDFEPENDAEAELLRKFPWMTRLDALAIAVTEEAIKNKNVRAAQFLRDTMGEKPVNVCNFDDEIPFEISIKTIE